MDNSRLKIEKYKAILYCEAYLDTEYTIYDVKTLINEVHQNFIPPIDVVLTKVGSYSLTSDAQNMLMQDVKVFRNFIYVVDDAIKRASAEFAALSYMEPYNARIASSKEEAFTMLKNK